MLDRIILKNHLKNLYYKFFNKKLLKNFPDWKDILRNIKFNDKDVDNSKKY